MNEQIRELVKRAGGYFPTTSNGHTASLHSTDGSLQKFAELIIEECIEQCNKKDPRPDRYSDWEEFAESRKVRECITSIKEHFRVNDGNT